jgi:hypothetical protein
LSSNTNGYGCKTHYTDSQNSDTTAPGGRELYHLQFSLQAASPKTFGCTLVFMQPVGIKSHEYPIFIHYCSFHILFIQYHYIASTAVLQSASFPSLKHRALFLTEHHAMNVYWGVEV